jgi:CBS domain-containing protein
MLCARDVMQPEVLSVTPEMSLAELADFLISARVSGVPVVEEGALVGIVSRSDIVRSLSLERSLAGLAAEGWEHAEFAPASTPEPLGLLQGFSPALKARRVRDIMVVQPVTAAPDTPITAVAQLLITRHLHRIVVTDGGLVCGVISSLDLVRLICDGRLREP